MFKVAKKLRNVKDKIKNWNKTEFGNIFESKSSIMEDISQIQDTIQNLRYDNEILEKEKSLLVSYHDIINKEEMLWRQRSRSIWLQEGDHNTRFFHLTILKHRSTKNISKVTKNRKNIFEEAKINWEAKIYFK